MSFFNANPRIAKVPPIPSRMPLSHHAINSRQQLSAALHQLSREHRHPQRLILPASLPVDHFVVPESVAAFLASARDYAGRTSAVNVGIY